MKYDDKKFIDLALSLGASRACIIDVNNILFNPEFRKFCEENACGFYGKNLMCPPDMGTVEQVISKAKSRSIGIFYETISPIKDFEDKDTIKLAGINQNVISEKMKQELLKMGAKDVLCMSTRCKYCDRCAKLDNKNCYHPDIAVGCLSAYCVDVSDLAKKCGMDYTCKEGTLSLFGLTLFNL